MTMHSGLGRNTRVFVALIVLWGFALVLPETGQAQEEKNSCVACHRELGSEFQTPVEDWEKSIHKETGVFCADCHGGDPSSMDMDIAHSEGAGFLGKPDPKEIPALCARCHSDVQRMRQYNIRTDQYAEYKTSVHGRLLLENGDTAVAICTSCHGNHEIRRKDDPLSSVYHTRVPETCGKCHSDRQRMQSYGIPTSQLEDYRASYHGQILYSKVRGKNPALVPNCADCHGIHGATPPGSAEVANVCGNCHSNNAEYFRKSPHYLAVQKKGIPRCIDCHGKHRIAYPDLTKFVGKEEGHCGQCHAPASPDYAIGFQIKQLLDEAGNLIEMAKGSMAEVKNAGVNMEYMDAELEAAQDKLIEVLPVTHSLSVEMVKKLMVEAGEHINKITKEVEKIREDLKRRKMALVVVIGVVAILVVLLCLERRRLRRCRGA